MVDFLSALAIERTQTWKKFLLVLSLLCNVGWLAIFKYLDFFTMSADGFCELFRELFRSVNIFRRNGNAMTLIIACGTEMIHSLIRTDRSPWPVPLSNASVQHTNFFGVDESA